MNNLLLKDLPKISKLDSLNTDPIYDVKEKKMQNFKEMDYKIPVIDEAEKSVKG